MRHNAWQSNVSFISYASQFIGFETTQLILTGLVWGCKYSNPIALSDLSIPTGPDRDQ